MMKELIEEFSISRTALYLDSAAMFMPLTFTETKWPIDIMILYGSTDNFRYR